MSWESVIGLEIHAQLKTKTKMFSSDACEFGQSPNTHISSVSLGLPGALPVINKEAVSMAIKTGLSFSCEINKKSEFSRKNYFYPDLPKGYQISQYDKPICGPGYVEIFVKDKLKKVGIERCHLEEDAGKSFHKGSETLIDLNRAGTPLLEIVSNPDMRTPQEAAVYAKTICNILKTLEVCDGNLEEGSLRCDCNVSVRKSGDKKFGTRVEIKNLNSYKFIEKAIEYEVSRQIEVLESGKEVHQQTRLFDSKKNQTFLMRDKEDSADYRYFPEPDLQVLMVEDEQIEKIKKDLPELPLEKAFRFEKTYKLPLYDSFVLTSESAVADYFEKVSLQVSSYKLVSNWIMTEVLAYLNEAKMTFSEFPISVDKFSELLKMIDENVISGKIAKDLFQILIKNPDQSPAQIVEEKNWKMISDEKQIQEIVKKILSDNPKQKEQYLSGKQKLFGFFVGQAMAQTKGLACPETLNKVLKDLLK